METKNDATLSRQIDCMKMDFCFVQIPGNTEMVELVLLIKSGVNELRWRINLVSLKTVVNHNNLSKTDFLIG